MGMASKASNEPLEALVLLKASVGALLVLPRRDASPSAAAQLITAARKKKVAMVLKVAMSKKSQEDLHSKILSTQSSDA